MSAASGQQSVAWPDVVALMRRDVAELGRETAHAPRFLQRCLAANDALAAQFRRAWGINAHEMQAVATLWEFGRMTMTELGRRIPLSRAAVTTLTDRLEKLGYVRRLPDPDDRRRILLEVTPRVEEEMARVQGRWSARVEEFVGSLDEATWHAAVDVLTKLREIACVESDALRELDRDAVVAIGGGPRRDDLSVDDADSADWW